MTTSANINPTEAWEAFRRSMQERLAKFQIPDLPYLPIEERDYLPEHYPLRDLRQNQAIQLWRTLAQPLRDNGYYPQNAIDANVTAFIANLSPGQIGRALQAAQNPQTPDDVAINQTVTSLMDDYFTVGGLARPVRPTPADPAPEARESFPDIMARLTAIAREHELSVTDPAHRSEALRNARDGLAQSGLVGAIPLTPGGPSSFSELMSAAAASVIRNNEKFRTQLSSVPAQPAPSAPSEVTVGHLDRPSQPVQQQQVRQR